VGEGAGQRKEHDVNVKELRLGFSSTNRNPEGILSHSNYHGGFRVEVMEVRAVRMWS
jgi:hypothetical protein